MKITTTPAPSLFQAPPVGPGPYEFHVNRDGNKTWQVDRVDIVTGKRCVWDWPLNTRTQAQELADYRTLTATRGTLLGLLKEAESLAQSIAGHRGPGGLAERIRDYLAATREI